MEMHSLQHKFWDSLFHGHQNHDKRKRLLVNRIETFQGWFRSSLSQLCVYSGLEPQSTNPDPLNCEQALIAHLAKVTQTHFPEESSIQHFFCIPQSVSSLLFFIYYWQKHACIFPEAEFQRRCFLWDISTLLNYITRLLPLALRGKGNSYYKLMCAILQDKRIGYMNIALGKQNAHIIQTWTAMIRPSGHAGHHRKNTLFPSGEFLASKSHNIFFLIKKS